ncbi:aspartate/tyrosine/aromatic aminotransferase, partial [Moorena producens 3L]
MNWGESQRIRQVQTPMIPVVGEWIAQHPGTISLGQGVVHYPAPAAVGVAVTTAMQSDPAVDRYGLVRGTSGLLQAIEQKVETENQTTLADRSVVVTTGSNMGFLNAVLAIADVGDEIMLVSPYYFNHEMAIEIAGCRVVVVPTDSEYQLDLDRLADAITPKTKAIVTVSPNNPTGAVYPADRLTAVNQLCRERSLYHISDEAYEYFNYSAEPHFSPASLPESTAHTISLYTLSKAYGMAGWRVGYMVIPAHLEVAVKKIQDTNLVCPPIVNQLAAQAAMTSAGRDWCHQRIASSRP